jgi:hypothetical protein
MLYSTIYSAGGTHSPEISSMGSTAIWLGLGSSPQSAIELAVCSISVCLYFLTCKMGVMMRVPASQGYGEGEVSL